LPDLKEWGRIDLTHGNWTVADESLGIHERTQTCPRERDIHRNRL
jgi:hypothetical protein